MNETLRVLVVDDDEDDFLIVNDLLEDFRADKFDVEWCSNYEEAFNLTRRCEHDVYLIDFRLGPRSGLDLIEQLRSKGFRLPIILLTGQTEDEIDIEALKAGASDYLSKSNLETGILCRTIRHAVERTRAEEKLHESTQMLHLVMDTIPHRVFWKDVNSVYLGCNMPFAQDACLNHPGEIVGKTDLELFGEESANLYRADDKMVVESGESKIGYEEPMDRSNGDQLWVLTSKVPLRDSHGRVTGLLGTYSDITEQKKQEEERRQLQEKLEKAQRMESLGILAGGIAHDLNNMLGPLVGYPDLMLRKLDRDNPMRKQVERISRSARDAAEVIQDLLTLARRGRYEMKPTHLENVIEDYLDSPSYEKLTDRNPHVSVGVEIDRDVGNVNGSGPHLTKVLMNLVVNAFDAMEEGGNLNIRLSQKYLKKLPNGYDDIVPGEYISLRVSDSGSGISEEDIRKIFEPYYSTKTMGRSGTGLGLAVVYGIVKDHNGYYDIESDLGKGTAFELFFPKCAVAEEATEAESLTLEGVETVLVVDDVESQRELATEILESLGYTATSVDNAKDAVEFVKTHQPDLVVLDMIIGDGPDGLEVYRRMLAVRPEQRAIIASGYSATKRVGRALELGAGTYIKKPFTLESLGKAVRAELDRDEYPSEEKKTHDTNEVS